MTANLISHSLTISRLLDSPCAAYVKKLLCARCDPWSGHLFGVETNSSVSNAEPIPILCPSYCSDLYFACRDEILNWAPSSGSPWGADRYRDFGYVMYFYYSSSLFKASNSLQHFWLSVHLCSAVLQQIQLGTRPGTQHYML